MDVVIVALLYFVYVSVELDPYLLRWFWLVKWVFVVLYYIVFVFFWLGVVLVLVVVFVVILLIGWYLEGFFIYNVGVLCWIWWVGYYVYSAFGIDWYLLFIL